MTLSLGRSKAASPPTESNVLTSPRIIENYCCKQSVDSNVLKIFLFFIYYWRMGPFSPFVAERSDSSLLNCCQNVRKTRRACSIFLNGEYRQCIRFL